MNHKYQIQQPTYVFSSIKLEKNVSHLILLNSNI